MLYSNSSPSDPESSNPGYMASQYSLSPTLTDAQSIAPTLTDAQSITPTLTDAHSMASTVRPRVVYTPGELALLPRAL